MDSTPENSREDFFEFSLFRLLPFWPWYLFAVIFSLIVSYLYVKYSENVYKSSSVIEISEKSQKPEFSLPSSMNAISRDMVNLDNEIGVLKSFTIHERTVKKTRANIQFFLEGTISDKRISLDRTLSYLEDFKLHINPEDIKENTSYLIESKKGDIKISLFDSDESLIKVYDKGSMSTDPKTSVLPFYFQKGKRDNFTILIFFKKFSSEVNYYKKNIAVSAVSNGGDQIELSILGSNSIIISNYINTLVSEFDNDGIEDRQYEFKRTIEFVNSRLNIISKELQIVEETKRDFKKENNLIDISFDASSNANQIVVYDTKLFTKSGQKDLSLMLKNLLLNESYKLLPVNFGLDDLNINELVNQYNLLIRDMEKFKISAGENNPYVRNIQRQIEDLSTSILENLNNYIASIDKTIENLKLKEEEFLSFNNEIPDKEKKLRAIQRELDIKEALFLLLLQKKEEALINFAVVKPSIKIIDIARPSDKPVLPNKPSIYLALLIASFMIPTVIIFLLFKLDNKIHTKDQLFQLTNDTIPIWGEVPFIKNPKHLIELTNSSSRTTFHESIRMIKSNMKFSLLKIKNKKSYITLVTSFIKGEGKTLISANLASSLASSNEKTILIGTDLRNPQLHKLINLKKNNKGLSDIIYKGDLKNFDKYLIKNGKLDILLSGAIPPNPSELLSFDEIEKILNHCRENYTHIILDSAPFLLVSDTFEISKYADATLLVFRANFTNKKLLLQINKNNIQDKLKNINFVLNCVGESYKYNYEYSYNYEYGDYQSESI